MQEKLEQIGKLVEILNWMSKANKNSNSKRFLDFARSLSMNLNTSLPQIGALSSDGFPTTDLENLQMLVSYINDTKDNSQLAKDCLIYHFKHISEKLKTVIEQEKKGLEQQPSSPNKEKIFNTLRYGIYKNTKLQQD